MTDFKFYQIPRSHLFIELSTTFGQETVAPTDGWSTVIANSLFTAQKKSLLLEKRVWETPFPGNLAFQADTILCHLHMVPFLDI